MMMKLLWNISAGLILAVLILVSCAPMGRIGIQVAIPPKYPVSEDINSILLLNRSLTSEFVNMKQDSVRHIFSNLKSRHLFYDSIASDSAILTAAKAIFYSQRFDVVVPVHRNIWRDDTSNAPPPLDTVFINDLCKNFNVDAVLVLESFSEKIYGYLELPFRKILGSLDLKYRSDWRLYQPGQNAYFLNITANDTLYWYGGLDRERVEGFRQLPSIKKVLVEGGMHAGLNITDQICPFWYNEERYYYKTGDKNIDAAISLIKSDKWEEASEIWRRYSATSSASIRSKIEYNLALSEEMKGDIDLAVKWCKKSIESKPTVNSRRYLKRLQLRSEDVKKQKELSFISTDAISDSKTLLVH